MVSAKGLGSHLKTRVVAEISKEVTFPIKGSIPFASLEKRLKGELEKLVLFGLRLLYVHSVLKVPLSTSLVLGRLLRQ